MPGLFMNGRVPPGPSGPTQDHSPASRKKASRGAGWWYLLLLLSYLGLLWPAFYARPEPELFGFPFFYWYQFAWVPLSAALTGIVYFVIRRKEGR
jgi:hypothetical protein